ncbi:hypothetical protein J6590_009858 [Homalodisca vitripennis]|nr:hypothetical protein J6590_009858 [Homalodisca vitripennis]
MTQKDDCCAYHHIISRITEAARQLGIWPTFTRDTLTTLKRLAHYPLPKCDHYLSPPPTILPHLRSHTRYIPYSPLSNTKFYSDKTSSNNRHLLAVSGEVDTAVLVEDELLCRSVCLS